jgi:hypothetical protein
MKRPDEEPASRRRDERCHRLAREGNGDASAKNLSILRLGLLREDKSMFANSVI